MGVYIKGMKKPSDCQYCVMYRDGYCGAKGGFCHSEKGVDADCPIVEVVEVNESEIPNSSEKPNNCEDVYPCDTCKHNKLEWFSEVCDGCCGAHSNYEPKTEPQKCYLRESCDHYGDKQVCGRCREYNLYSHTKTEPQDWKDEMWTEAVEDEPQPRCPKCGKRGYIRSLESMGVKLKHFDEYKWKCTNCNKYFKEEPKDEPQTERSE